MRNAAVAVTLAALAGCSGGGQDPTGAVGSSAPGDVSTTLSGAPSGAVPPDSTGSGDPTGEPGAPGEQQPQRPPQRSAEPIPQAAPLEGAKVDAAALPETYDKQVQVGPDGRALLVNGLAGGCKNASAEVAAQSAEQVLVTLVTTYYPPRGGGACTDDLRPVPLTVTLDAPLGERRVVLESREEVG
ncbi:hypothetical protein CNX65_07395 [Actinosynnema pretiosum]|uniref:Lipoprotein n=2 Tax=Actinosynnema pretiosum TaxID=42197 RepID=A0A290Z2G0_9PSEU|nr:hypothetical protein CNX65_07395 [Actinosynnema pretiosum]